MRCSCSRLHRLFYYFHVCRGFCSVTHSPEMPAYTFRRDRVTHNSQYRLNTNRHAYKSCRLEIDFLLNEPKKYVTEPWGLQSLPSRSFNLLLAPDAAETPHVCMASLQASSRPANIPDRVRYITQFQIYIQSMWHDWSCVLDAARRRGDAGWFVWLSNPVDSRQEPQLTPNVSFIIICVSIKAAVRDSESD